MRTRWVGLATLLVGLGVPAVARATDSIYWTDTTSGEIRVANLNGTGTPRTLYGDVPFASERLPTGLALDPAIGKLYWFSEPKSCDGCWRLRVANLSGTASPQTLYTPAAPAGLAIDPALGKLYWADQGALKMARIDGTGSVQTLYDGSPMAPVGNPWSLTVDGASRDVFWTDESFVGAVRVASLDGRTSSDQAIFPNQGNPFGIAIDPVAAKAYWSLSPTSPSTSGTIMVGNDWGGSAQALFPSESNQIFGVALDPRPGQQKIYWASGGESVRVGNLNGTGTPQDLFTDGGSPYFLAILVHPAAAGAPLVSGGTRIKQQLRSTSGAWASDILGAHLYRAPKSFAYQWLRNGTPISGAHSPTFTPTTPGRYRCRVTASNEAGSTPRTSAAHTVRSPAAT